MNLHAHKKPQPVTQEGKILKMLKDNKKWGVWGYELSNISMSHTKRISNLREDGHNIQCVRITNTITKYFLNDEDTK